ncbi:unnamed protein product [Dicrocoelium dendriticum]|nr:unnamed protein product [Dicrocoelium dendriticum]
MLETSQSFRLGSSDLEDLPSCFRLDPHFSVPDLDRPGVVRELSTCLFWAVSIGSASVLWAALAAYMSDLLRCPHIPAP